MRGEDSAAVATLKGDARLAEVLRRALWSHVQTPTEGLVVPRGARRWRVAAYEAEELVASLRTRGVRYGAARAMVPQSLAHRVLVKMEIAGDSPDDRVQDAVARSKPVKEYANQLWPAVLPARLVWRLLADASFLAAAADGILDPDEQALLRWPKPPRSPGTARWSLADAVLLDEAADLVERTPSLAHIVADEAQDLSPMMLRSLARRSSTGSLTVLGDLAQATTPWATTSWAEALGHLGKPDAHVEQLTRGFRVPGEVIEYAARLLPHIAPDLEPPTSVRRSRGELVVVSTPPLLDVVRTAVAREGSVGLIVPDALVGSVAAELRAAGLGFARLGEEPATEGLETEFDQHLDLVPATLAKGLEFDHVVLLEPAAIVAGEPDPRDRAAAALRVPDPGGDVARRTPPGAAAARAGLVVNLADTLAARERCGGPGPAGRGVLRPEPGLPRPAAPHRGLRPARRAGRGRDGLRPDARAAGGVVPRRGVRRPARRRGALGALGRGVARRPRCRGRRPSPRWRGWCA